MLIAVCGFSGAGKTTALEHLRDRGFGRIVYAGGIVRREVVARGLSLTNQNEKLVRNDLRETHGADVLARRVVSELGGEQESGDILVDAICNAEEAAYYHKAWDGRIVTLSLEAQFDVRAARLFQRQERPSSADELRKRDNYERTVLRLDEVMADANHRVFNETDVDGLKRELNRLSAAWRSDGA